MILRVLKEGCGKDRCEAERGMSGGKVQLEVARRRGAVFGEIERATFSRKTGQNGAKLVNGDASRVEPGGAAIVVCLSMAEKNEGGCELSYKKRRK